jgi:hypothetical protein
MSGVPHKPIIRDAISDVLGILHENLEYGLHLLAGSASEDFVVLSNIAFAENTAGRTPDMSNRVVITLIKVEEEATMKNQPAYQRNPENGNLEYVNPPVFLNLYLLFAANYADYDSALKMLSRVVGYFQYKRVFSEKDAGIVLPNPSPILHFDFNLSLVSPSFEQLNHIWGTLGGKMLPHVIYKLQLLRVEYIPDEVLDAPIVSIIEVHEKIF